VDAQLRRAIGHESDQNDINYQEDNTANFAEDNRGEVLAEKFFRRRRLEGGLERRICLIFLLCKLGNFVCGCLNLGVITLLLRE